MYLTRGTVLLVVAATVVATAALRLDASQTTETIDPRTLKPSPIRHKELDPALIERVRAFEPVFADVYPIAHQEWLEGFQRDAHPEKEIAVWEQIALAFTQFTSSRDLSKEARKEVFGLLLFRSGATAESTLKRVKLKYLTQEEARALVNLYKAPPQPISVERR
jgi:hypothetical protein